MPILVKLIGTVLTLILIAISAFHFYWALGGEYGKQAAIPTNEGQPLFIPGRFITAVIGLTLLLCALVAIVTSGLVDIRISIRFYKLLSIVISIVFVMRAIGDFKYAGFFKRVRDTEFAKRDSSLFSPLCLLIAVLFLSLGILA